MFHSFRVNRQGIIAPMVVGITLIITSTMLWVLGMYPVGLFWDALGPMMPRQMHDMIGTLNIVSGVVLIIVVVGTLIWMAVWASQKDVVDIPA